ncbi:ParB/Srx family N-terminal domain-containing protein [Steroidobacter agaridevorans]|uniref:ParB/Srx family N-terminal domain-containing protein n=1 Tax=Steroidobacter agaridevorans TaxID=2695856 RepID=UPI001329537C|nr:ParB/Srx family N-terminal domain-containing protein [Steroidobacter agaridevorans]GFE90615.1 hypothetical protein GCM10011488_55690 [Steroidobacter agaridevorans]
MVVVANDDSAVREAAFEAVREISEVQGDLTFADLSAGFQFQGVRVPLTNPRRGIFKPQQMQYLLSIRTVFPKPGARVWYDDQRSVHGQIYQGEEQVEYAFMGTDANAADNRWLREAMESRTPIIYFLGVAPGLYKAIIPTYVVGWDASALKASIAFGAAEKSAVPEYPATRGERRYALRQVKQRLHQASFRDVDRFPIESIGVADIPNYGSEKLDEEAIRTADLIRPILLAEISPGRFNLIDGHHRVARARREEVATLPAHRVACPFHVPFLTSTHAYERYVEYWNGKVASGACR